MYILNNKGLRIIIIIVRNTIYLIPGPENVIETTVLLGRFYSLIEGQMPGAAMTSIRTASLASI
jgi:hypothetical protein